MRSSTVCYCKADDRRWERLDSIVAMSGVRDISNVVDQQTRQGWHKADQTGKRQTGRQPTQTRADV